MVERALAASTADGCVAIVDETTEANIRWANNTLTTNGVTRQVSLTCVAVVGSSVGVVSRAGAFDIADVVAEAEASARTAPAAEDFAPLIGAAPEHGWDAPPETTSMAAFASMTPALGEAFRKAEASDRRLFGFALHRMHTSFVGTSAGLRARHVQPTGHVEINAKSAAHSAWAGVPAVDPATVDIPAIDASLTARLEWGSRSRDLAAGRYEVILPPTAVADLMIDLYWSATARDAHDGRTVFSRPGGGTRVGDRLSELPVTLSSDPHAAGIGCAPFVIAHRSGADQSVFDNGLPVARTDWIADGTLRHLVQTRASAALTGLDVTPVIDNLRLDGADRGCTLDEMVAHTDRGLLLTCLWYIREVDPQTLLLTGLTRDGVYAIEGGEVVGAVNNFRFNESPVALLARATEIGATDLTLPREWSDYFTRTAMPPLRIPDFNMSSVSPAS